MPDVNRYVVGLGSNRRHRRYGPPRKVIEAAIKALPGYRPRHARIIETAPMGPSRRRYANAAAMICVRMPPDELLRELKHLEADFGRRRGGQRWGERVLDLDILLWDGGIWAGPALAIPHPRFRERRFVLGPLAEIAPLWRDPVTGLRIRHLKARLDRPCPRD